MKNAYGDRVRLKERVSSGSLILFMKKQDGNCFRIQELKLLLETKG